MFRLVSVWTALCLLLSMTLPYDSWARGSRSSGVSVSRSSSSIAYSRASSSVSVSRPAAPRPTMSAARPSRPSMAPPTYSSQPRYVQRSVAPQAIAQSRSVSNRTVNNTTIIHNTTRNVGGGYEGGYGGGGGYNRGPGLGSQILAGAAGAVAGNMVYDALTDRNHNNGAVQAAPVQMAPVQQAVPMQAAAPVAQAPVQQDPQQQIAPAAAPQVDGGQPTTPSYNESGVGVAYTPQPPVVTPVDYQGAGSWSWVLKIAVLIGCIGGILAIVVYVGNRTRRPSVAEDTGVVKTVITKMRTYAPLFIKNVNLVPGLKVVLPQSVLGGEEDWSYVGDRPAGTYPVKAIGANDICAHLYLDADRNEFIRVMLGSESGGAPKEAFFFSRIEECYTPTGDISSFVHGKIDTYANRKWDLFWARPISSPDAPMVMGTEIIQNADHTTTKSSYSDWMYRRDTGNGGDEYLFIRRRRDDTGDYYIAYAGTDYPVSKLP